MKSRYGTIIDNFVRWGNSSEKLSAAIMIGSEARANHGADEFSDLDLILITGDPEYFLTSDEWLNRIGTFHITFTENTMAGQKERRVLFDGALDADFVILPEDAIRADSINSEAATIL